MRIALAGLGAAATRGHLPALSRLEAEGELRLVAVADRSAEQRGRFGSAWPSVPVFGSVAAMLATVESDLLVIATPTPSHAELIELGIGGGRHVVCEKPLGVTAADRDALRTAASGRDGLGIVGVHQYRYSLTWNRLAPWIRIASAAGVPFRLLVEVCRDGADDPHAASAWRLDPSSSGGMLADHGAHFIALAWTIAPALAALGGRRTVDAAGRERSWGQLAVGSGVIELRMSAAVPARRTRLELTAPGLAVEWGAKRVELRLAGRRVAFWRAGTLSDRRYLDSLYLAFYRDLARNLPDPAWRSRRTAESLGVGGALIDLLELIDNRVTA